VSTAKHLILDSSIALLRLVVIAPLLDFTLNTRKVKMQGFEVLRDLQILLPKASSLILVAALHARLFPNVFGHSDSSGYVLTMSQPSKQQ
jgi:hypothetical protein